MQHPRTRSALAALCLTCLGQMAYAGGTESAPAGSVTAPAPRLLVKAKAPPKAKPAGPAAKRASPKKPKKPAPGARGALRVPGPVSLVELFEIYGGLDAERRPLRGGPPRLPRHTGGPVCELDKRVPGCDVLAYERAPRNWFGDAPDAPGSRPKVLPVAGPPARLPVSRSAAPLIRPPHTVLPPDR